MAKKRPPLPPDQYRQRTYRQRARCVDLVAFPVVCQETDLMVQADRCLDVMARETVLRLRGYIEGYIRRYPHFAATLKPWPEEALAPEIIRTMIQAGSAAGVGPMAAVAGAMAEAVGRDLLNHSRQVVVENGGDIFMKTDRPSVVGLFAGASPLSMKIGIKVPSTSDGTGLCTSSATVGHSLSRGKADAVCVVSPSCALADAAATAIGNLVKSPETIRTAIDQGRRIDGVLGIVVVVGKEMGLWGEVELIPLGEKKVEFSGIKG